MSKLDPVVFGRAMAEEIRRQVTSATSPLTARIAELEARAPVPGKDGAPGKDGKDGVDGAPGEIGPSGLDATNGVNGKDGKDGINGVDGKDGTNGNDGTNGKDGVDGKDGSRGNDGINGKDGIDGKDGTRGNDGIDGKDGVDGKDGTHGIDGKEGTNGKDGRDGLPGVPGRDGADGLGFDDLEMEYDGERAFKFILRRGDRVKEFEFVAPIVLDRGVWKQGQYSKADGVTWGGSFWIAQKDTTSKPDGGNSDWRLAVKRGRDGKDAKPALSMGASL